MLLFQSKCWWLANLATRIQTLDYFHACKLSNVVYMWKLRTFTPVYLRKDLHPHRNNWTQRNWLNPVCQVFHCFPYVFPVHTKHIASIVKLIHSGDLSPRALFLSVDGGLKLRDKDAFWNVMPWFAIVRVRFSWFLGSFFANQYCWWYCCLDYCCCWSMCVRGRWWTKSACVFMGTLLLLCLWYPSPPSTQKDSSHVSLKSS